MFSFFLDALLKNLTTPDALSWLVLIRQAAHLLLESIANFPTCVYRVLLPTVILIRYRRSTGSQTHARVLDSLLSIDVAGRVLGPSGSDVTVNITDYLLARGFYQRLRKLIVSLVRCLL